MKIPVNIIPQSPLYLRFCVRMICCQVFLVSVFISSQTLFSGSDSIIYISGEASFYKDPQTIVSVSTQVDPESSGSLPPVYHNPKTLKSSLRAASATAFTTDKKGSSFFFKAPAGSQQFNNPGGFCSQAITGDYFSRKLFWQIISPALSKAQSIISEKKKIYGITSYDFKVIKISLQQYSRPPPVI